MELTVFNETSENIDKDYWQERLSPIIKRASKFKQSVDIGLVFVNVRKIENLNKVYADKDSATDVLSFKVGAGLGDIFICVELAHKQAISLGRSFGEEIVYLFTHGLLHLLGFDHQTPEELKIMEKEIQGIIE